MTLPQDPYETTTELLIAADLEVLGNLDEEISGHVEAIGRLAEQKEVVEARLNAYSLTLESYRNYRPAPTNGHGPYNATNAISDLLRGLSHWQKLVVVGLISDRRVSITPVGKFLHSTGEIGGKWKHVPSRLYKLVADHPDIFVWVGPGDYDILPDAERFLPASTLELLALASGTS